MRTLCIVFLAAIVTHCMSGAIAAAEIEDGPVKKWPLQERIDALAAMIGEKDVPKVIAQGVLDVTDLPVEGEERTITIPLIRPLTNNPIGSLTLILRA